MPSEATPAPQRVTAMLRAAAPVAFLLGCFVVLGLTAVDRKSVTFDESAHFAGGLSYWVAGDYRLHPENGNWTQRWATLPAWLSGYRFPPREGLAWRTSYVWAIAEQLFFGLGNDADAMLRSGRMMMAIPAAFLGLLVYFWSRRLFGPIGGLLSLTLYAFSPTMLANGFLTTSDTCAALFFTASLAALWTLLHRVSFITLVAAGIALSGLMLVKFSGVLIAPITAILVVIRLTNPVPLSLALGRAREVSGRLAQLGIFAAAALVELLFVVLVIWASYGFRYATFAPEFAAGSEYQLSWDELEGRLAPVMRAVVDVARERHLLPEGYLYGFTYTVFFSQVRNGFLHGEFSLQGWTSFFPICLAIKTPLSLFLLLGLALWACAVERARPADGAKPTSSRPIRQTLYDVSPLLILIAVYWYFALRSNLNIGHRHLLPTYPAMFILAGAAAQWLPQSFAPVATRATSDRGQSSPRGGADSRRSTLVQGWVVIAALAVTVVEGLWMWPDYLAYFNALAGGPRHGYRWLIDSSLDWGQDLKELKRWLDEHPDDSRDPTRVYLSYFGTARPDYYRIAAQPLPSFFPHWDAHTPMPLTGGLYCLSANMLDAVYTMPFPGRWNAAYEQYYQEYRQLVSRFHQPSADAATSERLRAEAASAEMQENFRIFEVLRLARLTSFLRQREPDDEVGYSILIYRLSDEDIRKALVDPPVENLAEPELKLPPAVEESNSSQPAGDAHVAPGR